MTKKQLEQKIEELECKNSHLRLTLENILGLISKCEERMSNPNFDDDNDFDDEWEY